MKYRFSFLFILLPLLALMSCGNKQQEQKEDVPEQYPMLTVKPEDKTLSVKYTAVLEGRQVVEVRPEVSGLITKVCVDEGAHVRRGQVLFVIDQVPYKAALEKAQAAVATAEANLANARLTLTAKEELYKEKIVADYEVNQARNTYNSAAAVLNQAKAEVKDAQNNLSYTEVRSPVDGIAGMTSFRVGALVGPTMSEPLITVSDNAQMHAYFTLSEKQALELTSQYGSLDKGAGAFPPVMLELSDGQMYDKPGRIDVVSSMVDKSTGTVSLRANFPNTDGKLMNGGSANLVLSYIRPASLVIPQGATYELQNKVFTYKVVNGKTVATPIEVFKINDGKEYIVTSGLKEGDVIVSEGAGLLKAGTKVTQLKDKPKATPAKEDK